MRRASVLFVALACAAMVSARQPASFTITGVTVIDGDGTPPHRADVTVRDGLIASVTRPGAERPGGAAETIDGTGQYLVPALWDMHVHLATRPEPELAERMMLPLFLANGIVGIRDMGGPLDRVLSLRDGVRSGRLPGPRILTPGPFVDGPGEAGPLFQRPRDVAAAATAVDDLASRGVDFIKVQSGLAADVQAAVVAAARRHRLPVAGHIPTPMTLEEVIASGQRSVEHVSPALVGDGMVLFACSTKSAELLAELRSIEKDRGSVEAAAIARREIALRASLVETYDPVRARALGARMKDREVWLVPTLVWSATLRPIDTQQSGASLPMKYVPVALRERWLRNRGQYLASAGPERFEAAAAVARTSARAVSDLRAGGARVLAGTDAFDAFVLPGYSLHQELQMLVEAGFSPLQALQAATKEAAAFRGASKSEGTIAAGKRADMLLLSADPLASIASLQSITATIHGGRIMRRAELDTLLEGVARFADGR